MSNGHEAELALDQDLKLRIASARGQLSANDERIAAFLIEHLHDLAFHTAESLAQGAGVSPAAVVRFARRIEFASFRQLRDRARSELQLEQGRLADEQTSTLARKIQRDITSLELLPRLLDESLHRAAKAVSNAKTTWFLANRETYGLVVYAHRLLHHARANVRLVDPSFPDPLRELDDHDVVLAATFRPYARETVELVAHARAAGSQVILLTDGMAHPFIAEPDIVLAVPVDSPTLFLSFTPALCVLETLASLISMLDADQTYDTLEATAKFMSSQRLTLEPEGFNNSRPPRRATADPPDRS